MLLPSPPVHGAAWQPLHGGELPSSIPIPLWGRRGAGRSSQPHCLTLDFGDEGPSSRQGLQGVEQGVLADDLAQDAQGFTQALVGQRPLGLLGICKRGGLRCCILVPYPCPVSLLCIPVLCPSQAGTCHLPDAANPPALRASQDWHGHILVSHPSPQPWPCVSCPAWCCPGGSLTFEACFSSVVTLSLESSLGISSISFPPSCRMDAPSREGWAWSSQACCIPQIPPGIPPSVGSSCQPRGLARTPQCRARAGDRNPHWEVRNPTGKCWDGESGHTAQPSQTKPTPHSSPQFRVGKGFLQSQH